MRVLILGATGMLGHKLCQLYRSRFDTWATVRTKSDDFAALHLIDPKRLIRGVDAFDFDTVIRAIATCRPHVVINCIGIIKQLPTAKDPIISLTINSLFPHKLANICQAANARMIHISTDCVFSGLQGHYTEADISDAQDLYGRTKFLGEVESEGCLTLRTSIIGREISSRSGLVEWFLANQGGTVNGYTNAIYTGFTTLAMSGIIANVIEEHQDLTGVWQVSSDPINKYELLHMLRQAFAVSVEIRPYGDVRIDRSLDSSRFRQKTGFVPPSWEQMIHDLAGDQTPYNEARGTHV
jgi:dTDP-4-dehydrorhamnose reductase